MITAHSSFTFSAKERDTETGLGHFESRYYHSDEGYVCGKIAARVNVETRVCVVRRETGVAFGEHA